VAPLVDAGYVNSLAQTLLKLTAPGVPDIYQGQETWDFSLVDPDNRRPVDYRTRRELLDRIQSLSAAEAWADRASGTPKLMTVARALGLRAADPDAFSASYEALNVRGLAGDHAVAFCRGGRVATIVPRLTHRLETWADTAVELPPGAWRDVLTGVTRTGTVGLAEVFDAFPVALLAKELA
jgi:(1->4)-alpha-D-glucan 1-alpha-D-glucosylmutase